MMKNRAVIIGGAGFLGGHLVDLLLEKKYKVLCIDRDGCNRDYLDSINIPVVTGDIRDIKSIEAHLQKGDVVFHLAAYLGLAKVSREQFFELNVTGAVNVLKAAINKEASVFVFTSSTGAVGPAGSLDNPITEDTPCMPDNVYAETKYIAEQKIHEIAADKIPCVICRQPSIYGPRANSITTAAKLFNGMRKKTFIIIGNTLNKIPFIYVKNLASALIEFSEQKQKGVNTYILSDKEIVIFKDILLFLRKEFNTNKKIVHIPYWFAYAISALLEVIGKIFRFDAPLTPDKVKSIGKSVNNCDISKALKSGYNPSVTLFEGLHITAEWIKQNSL